MDTHFALLARFQSPVVELKYISEEFLGLKPRSAESKSKTCDLPFPTLKLRNSERSPTMVRVADLADYIDMQYRLAKKEWDSTKTG